MTAGSTRPATRIPGRSGLTPGLSTS
jgi:hypothetical protein